MKKESNVRYNIETIEKAFSNIRNYSVLDIDIEELYNFTSKEKHNLKRIQSIYSNIKLYRDHQIVKIKHFSDQEALDKANSFLIQLFPKKEKEILELDRLIEFGDINETGVIFKLSRDNVDIKKILLPTNSTNYTASIIAHEKTHALTFNNIDLKTLFENNYELLPILLQKMILADLDDPYSIILDSLVRINDTKSAFNHIEIAKYLRTTSDRGKLDEYMSSYYNIKGYNYLLSELYANLLMLEYVRDPESLIRKLNLVFSDKLSISDFLASYQITLTNPQLIPTIKQETNKCKRISIIP